jgi:predicted ferric reductase
MADISAGLKSRSIPSSRSFESQRARRAGLASALWLLFLTNSVIIVAIWLADGGVAAVHSWGELFNSIGRITGLLSAHLILVQIILLARLPWLERLVGFDRLTIWHRRNGKLSLYLVLTHVVFITVGYAMVSHVSIRSQALTFLQVYPGMVSATVGTVLMIGVVLTSIVIVRRRMRYELWYIVHFTAYLAIGLSWIHQIPTGNDLAVNMAAANYWIGLYLATLAILVLFRVGQPLLSATRHRLRVSAVTVETPGVVSLRLSGRHLNRMHARSGQFFLFRFLAAGRWWESHPFSLSAAPSDNVLRITVKHAGDFTSGMGEIPVGTRVIAEGPFGVFTEASRHGARVLMIAGGIGITPIRAMLEDMSGDLVLIYRVVRDEDVIFREELRHLAGSRNVRVHIVAGNHTDPGAESLLSADHLKELVPDIASRDVYICGPPVMSDLVERNVLQAGVRRKFIHAERFAL